MNSANSIKTKLKEEFSKTSQNLLTVLSSFDQRNINAIPFENSWTAAQVGEHLVKSVSGLVPVLTGPAQATDRDPEEKEQLLRDTFLNFELKFKSMQQIIPSNDPHEKENLISMLKKAFADFGKVIQSKDLTCIVSTIPLPVFGELSRAEWCYLVCYHTQKHINQLKNIRASFN